MAETFQQQLKTMPFGRKLNTLLTMLDDVTRGHDATLAALRDKASAVAARMVVVGGIAVIRHGYERTTTDRDVFVDHRSVNALADSRMDDADWERLEIRQYAFAYKPTGVSVDFLVAHDLVTLGRPYYFPDIEAIETTAPVEGIPVIGLNDLVWFKLLAGRMRDLADIMELCKLNPGAIDPDRVLARLQAGDEDLRTTLLDIIRRAPLEIAAEQRLGQGEVIRKSYPRRDDETNKN